MIDYRLYLVTDDPSRYAGSWLDNVRAAVEGGVTCVQYRDTESTPDDQFTRIRQLQDALAGRDVALIVNNDPHLAKAVQADGIHVGQGDMPVAAVRALVGTRCEVGLSITNRAQLAALRATQYRDVNGLGLGPVFDARKTKRDASDALGTRELAHLCRELDAYGETQPLVRVAIGGITRENAAPVLDAGVQGLAVVSAFSKAEDPFSVARSFRALLERPEVRA